MSRINEFKKYILFAFMKDYGFAPRESEIHLLSTHYTDEPQYCEFEINGHEYAYDGYTIERRVS